MEKMKVGAEKIQNSIGNYLSLIILCMKYKIKIRNLHDGHTMKTSVPGDSL